MTLFLHKTDNLAQRYPLVVLTSVVQTIVWLPCRHLE